MAEASWFDARILRAIANPLALEFVRGAGCDCAYVMDFGCGTGISIPLLLEVLKAEQVIGLDPSRRSLEIARETVASANVRLLTAEDYVPHRELDLVFAAEFSIIFR